MVLDLKPEYIDDVVDLWLSATIKAHPFIESSFWISQKENMKYIYLPQSLTRVCFDDKGNLIGFISLLDNYIATLFVSVKHQGMGYGTLLLDDAKSKRDYLNLCVYVENQRSIAFYLKQQFRIELEQTDNNTDCQEYKMSWINKEGRV